jgi:mRNA-degrading endonuclease RelE of RelBE toxin-antitoxin system
MYRVIVSRSAEKEMERLPLSVSKRVDTAIFKLRENPRPPGSKN